jgi:hypothetical protein
MNSMSLMFNILMIIIEMITIDIKILLFISMPFEVLIIELFFCNFFIDILFY